MIRFPRRLATQLTDAQHGLDRRLRARARRRADGGFVLLESIMTISLITIVMAALAAFFINGVATTNQQRARQLATQVATSAVETVRGVQHPSQVLAGRDATSVANQFTRGNASAEVRPWIEKMSQAIDSSAPSGAGATATIPTVPVTQTVNSTVYSVNNYLGWCAVATGSQDCVAGATGLTYLRAVVAVTWHDAHCSGGTCTYVTGTLLSAAIDPSFSLKQAPPSMPSVHNPGPQTSMATENVNLSLTVEPGTGVPTFTWLSIGNPLPAGLDLSPEGVITGKPIVAGTTNVTLQVTDSFTRTATATFSWTILPKLTIAQPADQISTIGKSDSLVLTTTGGNDPYVYTVTGLPTGLYLSGSQIIGTPTVLSVKTVQLTVTDLDNRTTTVSFKWSVVATPTVNAPVAQTSSVGAAINVTLTSACLNTTCTYALVSGPPGLTINSSGVITGTIGGAAATYSTASITVTDSASATGTSGTFSWTVKAAPTITAPAAQTTTVGATVNLAVVSTCAYAPCSFTLNTAPPGLTINGSGVITGTVGPVGTPPQTYTSSVSITDAAGVKISSGNFTWTVKAPPTITAPGNQSSNIGASVTVPFTATCANTPCTYSLNYGPPGLSIVTGTAITGTVGGLPQTYTASVTVTDAAGVKATTSTFTWTTSYPPLQATTPPSQSSTVNTAITSLQVTVSGGSGNYSWSGALPAGLIMTTGGLITGTPTALGSATFNLTVTDIGPLANASMTVSFTWTVLARPTVTAPLNQTTTVGATINVQLPGPSCPNSPCTYTLNNGPATLSINSSGLITGTITSGAQTFSPVTVTIRDKAGATANSGTFTWTVKAAPSEAALAAQTTTVGATVNVPVPTPTCPNSPCTLALTNGPPGLSIVGNAVVGTPGGMAQVYNTTITVTDAAGVRVNSPVFTWTVKAPPTATPVNQTTTLGASANWTVPSTCGNTPCTFVLTGAPTGLSINNSGVVSGTVGGSVTTYNFTVKITDAASVSATSSTFTWTVKAAPTITAPANQTTTVDATINLPLTSSCWNTPCTYTMVTGPATLSINSSGLITGTITSGAQTFSNVTVRITDASGVSATSSPFTWKINAALTLTTPPNQTVNGGAADTLDVSTLDGGGTTPFTYSAAGLPAWLSINASTGVINTVPTAPAARTITSGITVTVRDNAGVSVTSGAFQWIVNYPTLAIPDQATLRSGNANIDLDNYAVGGTGPYTYTYTGKPSWLTYSPTNHTLIGTAPSTTSTNAMSVTVTDSAGGTATSAFTWRVYNTATTLVWSSIPDRSSVPNVAATSLTVTGLVSNDKAPYTAVGLPPGLTINGTTGVISGTPTQPGRYRVSVTATDNTNSVAIPSATFIWQVTGLTWNTIPSQTSTRTFADSLNATLYDSGGISPYTYTASGLPNGLTISASSGLISGTPTLSAPFSVTVTVTDLSGASATSAVFTWTVSG